MGLRSAAQFHNNDPDRFARTKKAILEIYDAMAAAIHTGDPYRTDLNPRPATAPATRLAESPTSISPAELRRDDG